MSEVTPPATPPVDHAAENAALKAKIAEYEAKLKPANPPTEDDLATKAKKEREDSDRKVNDLKLTENAIAFSLKSQDFLKNNESLLPKNTADIFKAADKEKYNSAVEKDAALKSGLIQAYFEVQSNLDLLTPSQKNQLDEYLKLTKTGKQDKAQAIYDSIFEPTLEMARRIRRAEALSKGHGDENSLMDNYKNKLISGSKKHYLGEKQ